MKRLNILIVLAIAMLLAGCEAGGGTKGEEEVVKNFVITDIEYLLDDDSGMEDVVVQFDPLTFTNNTSTEQMYIFSSDDHFSDRSHFRSSDTLAFSFMDDVQKVKVPVMIGDGSIICDDGTRWSYVEGEQTQKSLIGIVREIPVKPGHTMEVSVSLTVREMTAKYRLKAEEVISGEIIEVEGDWSGALLVGCSTIVTFTE